MNNWYTVTKNYSRCPYLNNVTLNLIHNILTSKKITSQTFFRQIYTLILYKGRFLFHFCLPVKKIQYQSARPRCHLSILMRL